MSEKLTIQLQAHEESLSPPSRAAVGDEEKGTSSTFSLSCITSQDGLPLCKRSFAQPVTECNTSLTPPLKVDADGTGRRQTPCAPQQDDDCSPSPRTESPRPSTFEPTNKNYSTHQACSSIDLSRKNLMILIQIMLKYLDYNDRRLCAEAKKAVADCTKKNREGHPEYRFLVDAITSRLRLVVGDMHWSQLENLMEHYKKKRATPGMPRSSNSVHRFVAV